jgi:hypothetical protein
MSGTAGRYWTGRPAISRTIRQLGSARQHPLKHAFHHSSSLVFEAEDFPGCPGMRYSLCLPVGNICPSKT